MDIVALLIMVTLWAFIIWSMKPKAADYVIGLEFNLSKLYFYTKTNSGKYVPIDFNANIYQGFGVS